MEYKPHFEVLGQCMGLLWCQGQREATEGSSPSAVVVEER